MASSSSAMAQYPSSNISEFCFVALRRETAYISRALSAWSLKNCSHATEVTECQVCWCRKSYSTIKVVSTPKLLLRHILKTMRRSITPLSERNRAIYLLNINLVVIFTMIHFLFMMCIPSFLSRNNRLAVMKFPIHQPSELNIGI